MRSCWHGYHGTALVLTETECRDMFEKYIEKHPVEGWLVEDILEDGCVGSASELEFEKSDGNGIFQISRISGATGCDGMWFVPFISKDGRDMIDEDLYVLWGKDPAPFGIAYPSYLDIVEEFQSTVGGYLPENFDWDNHIGELTFAQYMPD